MISLMIVCRHQNEDTAAQISTRDFVHMSGFAALHYSLFANVRNILRKHWFKIIDACAQLVVNVHKGVVVIRHSITVS